MLNRTTLGAVILTGVLASHAALAQSKGGGPAPKGKPFVVMNNEIVELRGQLGTLQQQIEDALQGTTGGSGSTLDTLEGRLDAAESAIASLEGQNAYLQSLITTYAGNYDAIEAELLALQQENQQLRSAIESNRGDVDQLRIALAENKSDLDALHSALLIAEESIVDTRTALQAQIDANQALITGLESEIASIETVLETKQNVLTGTCPSGQVLRHIYRDGSIVCQSVLPGITTSTVTAVAGVSGNGQTLEHTIACPSGSVLTGGGHLATSGVRVEEARPSGANSWQVRGVTTGGGAHALTGYARCLQLTAS